MQAGIVLHNWRVRTRRTFLPARSCQTAISCCQPFVTESNFEAYASRMPCFLHLLAAPAPLMSAGAILRSAYCLGASGLLTAGKNCAPLSPAVSKVGVADER